METRSYGGGIRPQDIARVLMAGFNNDRHQTTQVADDAEGRTLHIIARGTRATSLTVRLRYLDGSTVVELGQADGKWLDAAADVGQNLVGGAAALLSGKGRKPTGAGLGLVAAAAIVGSLPKTVRNLRLDKKIWFVIDETVSVRLKHLEMARRLLTCTYCELINEPGSGSCGACGAPLQQTVVCQHCQLANPPTGRSCLSCGGPLAESVPLATAPEVTRVCADCGHPAEPVASFCEECGQKLR